MTDAGNVQAASAEQRLATLAVLRAHWGAVEESFTDTFLPFALEAIRLEGGEQPVPLANIRSRMNLEFGVDIPHGTLETLLRRARDRQLGEFTTGQDRAFLAMPETLAKYDTATARAAAQREQAALIERFVAFSKETYDVVVSPDDAAEDIGVYLDAHATSLLAAVHGQELGETRADREADDAKKFMLSSFFAMVLDREPEVANYLERLVVGTMLASALYTPDLDRIADPFTCSVFLDTPTLIDALGHSGELPARAARESITLLRDAGATIKCFEHTTVEIERKLCDVAEHLRRNPGASDYADMIEENARARNRSAADLEQDAGRVKKQLPRFGIEVTPSPPHTDQLTIDEAAAESLLAERLKHSRKLTLRFDLDSITAIHRLRDGRPQYRLETCIAIFATPHGRLLWAARDIIRTGRNVPVTISLADLVTLAWLKKPRAAPHLPRLRIAADCYAAIQPSPGLIRRYVEEASRLRDRGAITEDDLYELRYGPESRRILMTRTRGVPSAVTTEAVQQILDQRNRSIAASAASDADRRAKAAQQALSEREVEAQELRTRVEALELDAQRRSEAELAAYQAELVAADTRAARHAKMIARPLFAVLLLAAVLVTLLSMPWFGPHLDGPLGVLATLPHGLSWVLTVLGLGLACVFVVLNAGWGLSIHSCTAALESTLRRRLATRYRPNVRQVVKPPAQSQIRKPKL